MSGEGVVVMEVVAGSVVEQGDGEVVVSLIDSGVELGDEREAVKSVSDGRVPGVAVSEVSVQAALAQGHCGLV